MKTESRRSGAPALVAYHLEGDTFGGVERHLVTLLAHLDRDRYEPVVLGRAPEEFYAEISALEVEMLELPQITSKWNARAWRKPFGSLRQLNPSVFHSMQSHSYSGQYALASAALTRVPQIVVTAHLPTPPSNSRQAWLANVLRRSVDLQIVPGRWAQSELRRLGQLARRTVIVPNAIDVPDFVPRNSAREILGVSREATVVGGLMRLEAYKRPDLIVDLVQALPGVTIVLFGEGPELDALVKRATGRSVLFTGFRADAARLLTALDVFVHPCPVDNQPLAVLEAMAGGVPVVAADQGGVATMITDERTGLLAPPSLEGMAAAVRRLTSAPDFAARIGAAAAAEVRQEADPRTMAKRIESLYQGRPAE